MPNRVIQASALTYRYPTVTAVDHLDLEIAEGRVFGLLGPNGAGKTTILRLVLGLLRPTAGTITVLGLDPARDGPSVRTDTGVLLEHTGVYERLSAIDNLDLFGRLGRLSRPARRERIESLLRHFELWDRRGDLVGTWSRGMRQRLAIARAMLLRPRLMLLDEPTVTSIRLQPPPSAKTSPRSSATKVPPWSSRPTTHDLAVAERLCDDIGVIRDGRMLAEDSPAGLRQNARLTKLVVPASSDVRTLLSVLRSHDLVRRAYVERDSLIVIADEKLTPAAIAPILAASVDRSLVTIAPVSLEDVYLTIMETDGFHVS